MRAARIPLRVVLYRDEMEKSVWIAHCLEFDLLGHGETHTEAIRSLCQATEIQVENSLSSGNIENLFNPAPAEFQIRFAQGKDVVTGEFRIEIQDGLAIEDVNTREYDDGYSEVKEDGHLAIA